MLYLMTAENLPDYLRAHGFVAADAGLTVEALGWGISNTVLKVCCGTNCFVVKQPLEKLRVADDWPFDRSRIFIERDCMALLGELLPNGSVPEVRFSDDENYLFAMSCAPESATLWEQDLLEDRIEARTGDLAGSLLADMHNRAALDPRVPARFGDVANFVQGRTDPYHSTAAVANPDIAPFIHAEVRRMLCVRKTLVHGDYSPKNLFLSDGKILMLDFEVAHYGDPAFDLAFCLNHLILPAIRFPYRSARYLETAHRLLAAYLRVLSDDLRTGLDANAVRELGCLMLARVDGKSKIPYIKDEPTRDEVRRLARSIILGHETSSAAVIDRMGAEIGKLGAG